MIYRSLSNPIAASEPAWRVLAPMQWAAITILSLSFTAATIALISRLRQAYGDERQQIK